MTMNLIMLPLEGVSQTLFWQYREAMPFLWMLYGRSVSFRRFYTASTSAFQSFCDVVHGDSSELDHNLVYPSDEGCLLGRAENLFGILADRGYATLGIQHGELRPSYASGTCFGAWPKTCGEFRWHGEYEGFYAESRTFLENSIAAGKPFALYCCDQAGTIADDCTEKRGSPLFHERLTKGYSLLDGTVRHLLKTLESLSLLDTTLIVIYGPYGMDPWKHAVSGGRTKAIEPYADACWTPLLFSWPGSKAQVVDDLASSIDLKATILGILFPGIRFGERASQFSGINLLDVGRNVAFTQNLFALEQENTGQARHLIKSYAATDGDQRLIVSSDGGIAGEGGMELYFDMRDPGNTRDLLDFFELDRDGNMISFGRPDIIHPHFTMSFKPNLVYSVMTAYNAMREILMVLSKTKEEEALKHCTEKRKGQRLNESQFKFKRRRR